MFSINTICSIFLFLSLFNDATNGQFVNNIPSFNFGNEYYDNTGTEVKSLPDAIKNVEKFIGQIMDASGTPSLVFSISIRGKLIWEKAWGYSDLENNVKANLDTKHRLASISKPITTALIATYVDQGLIHFDDPISKHINVHDFPLKYWNGHLVNITVGQLLDHTAGTHVTTLNDFDNVTIGLNCTQMIHKFADEKLLFKPGTNFAYSNYGYQLLGAIIESVSGKSYQQTMKEFFHKYQLDSTYVETSDLILTNRSHYYRLLNQYLPKENIPTMVYDDLFHLVGWWPSGGLMSTTNDLIKFGNLIINSYKNRTDHSIMSYETLKEMWIKRTTNFPNFPWHPNNDYGYGWFIAYISPQVNPNLKHRNFVWHSGGLIGATTFLIIYSEEEIVAAVFSNKGYVAGLDNIAIYAAESIYPFV